MNRVALLALSSCFSSAIGCAAATGGVPAEVLDPGQHEVTGGAGAGVTAIKLTPARAAPLPSLALTGGYRRGVARRVEWGARGWAFGLRGLRAYGVSSDFKVGLRDADESGGRLHVSLDPALAYQQIDYGGSRVHFAIASVALLCGWDVGERRRNQLVAGLRLDDRYMFGADLHPVNSVFGGFSVGMAWQLSRWFQLRPELSLLYSPVNFNGVMDDPDRRGATLVQLGVGGAYRLGAR